MAPRLLHNLVVLDNTVTNRGVAGSWNIVARRAIDEGLDWLVIVSSATRFGPAGGDDFLAALDVHPDAWVVEAGTPVGWHLIAWSRRHVLEPIGLFDEGFWPAYGEDADMSRRIHVMMAETQTPDAWINVDVDAWIAMRGHGAELGGVTVDMKRTIQYYKRKWGGWSGSERFSRPFGNRPIWWWPTPPHPLAPDHEGWSLT